MYLDFFFCLILLSLVHLKRGKKKKGLHTKTNSIRRPSARTTQKLTLKRGKKIIKQNVSVKDPVKSSQTLILYTSNSQSSKIKKTYLTL